MNTFVTSTPKGTEGHGISYSDEAFCAKSISEVLPKGWKTLFSWSQILFSDVQYRIDRKKKTIDVVYNQNLKYWTKAITEEIAEKIKE